MNHSATTLPLVTAILPAAGIGSRMQTDCPKQYLTIGHQSVIEHAIYSLLCNARIQHVIVAINLGDQRFKELPIAADPRISVTIGGQDRAKSVLAGLQLPVNTQWVLVHDAVRPCLHTDDLARLLEITEYSQVGGILASPISDTIKRSQPGIIKIAHTIQHKNLWRALTPQLFPWTLLKHCLQRALDAGMTITDEASALEYCGYHPLLVMGRSDNIKVTWIEDLALATCYFTQLNKLG